MAYSRENLSAKTTINDFDNHVLRGIFERLDFTDLSVIADVSTKFRGNARAVILWRYNNERFHVSNVHKNINHKLCSILRNFGNFVCHLELCLHGERSATFIEMSHEYFGETLTELSLTAWKFTAELLAKMKTILPHISTFKLDRCCWESASVASEMFRFCTGLRVIRIDCNYACEDALFLCDVSFGAILSLLITNPKLKEIKINCSLRNQITSQIFPAIVQHALEIENISMTSLNPDPDFIQNAISLKHLKALKSLEIDCCGLSVSPVIGELVAAHVPLENLRIINCQPNRELFDHISGLAKLKSLILNVNENMGFLDGFFRMLQQLCDLTHLYIDEVDGLLGADLLKIIRCSPKLSKLKIRLTDQYDELLDENEYNQILDLIASRRQQNHIEIKITIDFDHGDDVYDRNYVNVSKKLMRENINKVRIFIS